ncbi:hypothetical protein CYMTET_26021 [Cymbomonas tetramitiformis]|uniref:Uncharacterized protein n=1 Tax=Cymbomonas tetramitiformis TaxID=36881 RepID=A0AAE0FU67_9CHLO|nr:hypothetical protein CYMTET_26021 [Cymbomonas tetramitiformis]
MVRLACDWIAGGCASARECGRDGVEFMNDAAASQGRGYDIIIVDVASSVSGLGSAEEAETASAGGLQVPPPQFVAPEFLKAGGALKGALTDGGIAAFNVLAKSDEQSLLLEEIGRHFEHVCAFTLGPSSFSIIFASDSPGPSSIDHMQALLVKHLALDMATCNILLRDGAEWKTLPPRTT